MFTDLIKFTLITCCILPVAHHSISAQSADEYSAGLISKETDFRPGTVENPVMRAIRIEEGETILLDGKLDEDVWQRAPVATGFTQRIPHDGRSASEKTEVRVLYTNDSIYVGFLAYDSSPDSIMAPLFRRDGSQPSDWVYVSFDSYNDNRTAFTFAINPRGVQKDILYYDDSNEDVQWVAVWEAETQILENGWSAEMRIPFSQLRFSSSKGELLWGINFQRRIARKGEISFWAPNSQNDNRLVSNFGTLIGISELDEPRRLEIIPYAAGSMVRAPHPGNANPFYSRNQFESNIGGDVRYGISTDFTLTATVNPDFGQVEADPAVINLTAHETFFDEQRPFFQEGNEIFRFGQTKTFNMFGNTMPFYSRRIGRAPQGSPRLAGIDAEYYDLPDYSRIAGAAKLSGKTRSGWSIGVLDALTLQENAMLQTPAGIEHELAVEPSTNYMVTRVKKDFNSGNSYAGSFISAVNRRVGDTYFEEFLRSSAYLAGADLEHNFGNRNWVASGYFAYSSIHGSPRAIERAQTSPVRYFNRIDSDRLSVDPDLTTLTGYAAEMSIQKRGGNDRWLGSLTLSQSSPGYEVNDLGFQTRTNYRTFNTALVYRNPTPSRLLYYEFYVVNTYGNNYDGDNIVNFYGSGGFIRFRNQWNTNQSFNISGRRFDDRITRGGPAIERSANWSYNFNINTNPNRTISLNIGSYLFGSGDDEYNRNFWSGITAQPSTWLQLSFSPQINFHKNTLQYITTVEDASAADTFGHRYIFSDVEQTTLAGTFRANWTFSPTVSLQTYFRPFISSGKFTNYKELSDPAATQFHIYDENAGEIQSSNGQFIIDPGATGETEIILNNQDFNFRSIQGNAVFRWEYRPGSTLFFVWQQQRSDTAGTGNFDLGRDLGELFRSNPTNVFLVKASFWFGS